MVHGVFMDILLSHKFFQFLTEIAKNFKNMNFYMKIIFINKKKSLHHIKTRYTLYQLLMTAANNNLAHIEDFLCLHVLCGKSRENFHYV